MVRIGVAGCVCALLMMVAITGCSGIDQGPGGDSILIDKINEYVGDGGGSPKPWPFGPSASDTPSGLAKLLLYGGAPVVTTVPIRQTNWFRLPAYDTSRHVVVMVQPTADEDSDLFVMQGGSHTYAGTPDDCLGYSARTPAPTDPDIPGPGGFAPDWVAFQPGSTGGLPGAQIAVFGVPPKPSPKHFFIEVDEVLALAVGGAAKKVTLTGGHSAWFKFAAVAGQPYMVQLGSVTSGDPDVYVYGNASTKFAAKHDAVGGGSAAFVASETGVHFVRVRGHGSGVNANKCTVSVVNQAP